MEQSKKKQSEEKVAKNKTAVGGNNRPPPKSTPTKVKSPLQEAADKKKALKITKAIKKALSAPSAKTKSAVIAKKQATPRKLGPSPSVAKIRDTLIRNREESVVQIHSSLLIEMKADDVTLNNVIRQISSPEALETQRQLPNRDRNVLRLSQDTPSEIGQETCRTCENCPPQMTSTQQKAPFYNRFARVVLLILLAVTVALSGYSFYFINQYMHLNDDQTELTELRQKLKIKKIQSDRFSRQVNNFKGDISRIERIQKKLRGIVALENSPKFFGNSGGMGGPADMGADSFSTALDRETRSTEKTFSTDIAHLSKQAKRQYIRIQELDYFFSNQKSFLASIPSIWPARGWVTSEFGYRKSPFTGLRENHEGLDIAAHKNSPIRATADGVVFKTGRSSGYGIMLEIDHGYGMVTRFGHNSKNLVNAGERVKRGQIIALVGTTGRSTGPHLHYEVLQNRIPVNPKNYILDEY